MDSHASSPAQEQRDALEEALTCTRCTLTDLTRSTYLKHLQTGLYNPRNDPPFTITNNLESPSPSPHDYDDNVAPDTTTTTAHALPRPHRPLPGPRPSPRRAPRPLLRRLPHPPALPAAAQHADPLPEHGRPARVPPVEVAAVPRAGRRACDPG